MLGTEGTLVEEVGHDLAQWAINYVQAHPVNAWTTKASPADPVTAVDVAIERHVRTTIRDTFPGDVIVGEEMGGTPSSTSATWYLDPIDGTANLAHGLAWSSFSLARVDADGVQFGVVADVWRGSITTAMRDGGATREGRPLHVRDGDDSDANPGPGADHVPPTSLDEMDDLRGSLLLTELLNQSPWPGFEYFLHGAAERWATLRVPGSGALSLAQVAGMTDGATIIHEFHRIDHLAGAFIAREAGASVVDANGRPAPLPTEGPLIAATSPRLARAVACLYRHALTKAEGTA